MGKIREKLLKYKKWLFVAIAAVIAMTGWWLWQGNAKKTPPVTGQQTVKVERGDVASVVSASGTIQPVNSVDISSKITAQIKEVRVKENDQVKAGQVLVVLENDELQSQLAQAKEKVNNAAGNLERNQRLNAIGAVPDQQMDSLRMDYNIARENYDQVLSKLNEAVITSPIDGTVIGKPLPAGQTVAQGVNNPTVILTVADMSKLQIEVQVDQTDIGKVAVGQNVTFTVDAYPDQKFSGIVSNVSRKAVTQQNVIYYTVMVDINDVGNLLNPGMVARVEIKSGESKAALLLPLSAIRTDQNGKYVVVKRENGQTENVPVTTGIVDEDRVEVKSGVNEGDIVVIAAAKTQGQASTGQSNGQSTGQRNGGGGQSNPVGGMMRRF